MALDQTVSAQCRLRSVGGPMIPGGFEEGSEFSHPPTGSAQMEATTKCKTGILKMIWLAGREKGITDIRWQNNCAIVARPG